MNDLKSFVADKQFNYHLWLRQFFSYLTSKFRSMFWPKLPFFNYTLQILTKTFTTFKKLFLSLFISALVASREFVFSQNSTINKNIIK